uniref:UBX domain-containing protein n=2 Tax=Caenorhabditis tropicalis TaxID=1561998 RepID=A0A1I7U9G9_9PELO
MMSIAQQLVAMGYATETAELAAGNNRNMDQALSFIENDGVGFESVGGSPTEVTRPQEVEETKDVPVAAASYQCDDCGKALANDDAVMRHAQATKHGRFSESTKKELTAEEKAAQLADIVRKVKEQHEKKVQKAQEEEKGEELERRSAGQAMASYREEAREREVREAARLRVLQKAEDEVARKRVLEQIRLDREERKAKAIKVALAPEPVAPLPKDYSKTMIQFRLLDGSTVKQEFDVTEPLMMVRGWIQANHAKETPFSLMMAFPRRVFTEEDMGTPLQALNLVPTASLNLMKRTNSLEAASELQ